MVDITLEALNSYGEFIRDETVARSEDKQAKGTFRTISEVSDLLDTPPHVLRFWESQFSQIKPVKRAGGRRYYRPEDVALISGMKRMLHDDAITIKGLQEFFRSTALNMLLPMEPWKNKPNHLHLQN